MARRGPHLELDPAQRQRFAVVEVPHGEGGLGAPPVADVGTGGGRQLEMAGHEVGVQMRLDHVPDLQPVCLGVLQVLAHVPLRVDDNGVAGGLVTDEVGRVGQAAQVVLPEYHRASYRL